MSRIDMLLAARRREARSSARTSGAAPCGGCRVEREGLTREGKGLRRIMRGIGVFARNISCAVRTQGGESTRNSREIKYVLHMAGISHNDPQTRHNFYPHNR